MFKMEYHVQLPGGFTCIPLCMLHGGSQRFPHGHDIIPGQHPAVHFPQILMHPRSIADKLLMVPIESVLYGSVREILLL